MKRRVWRYVLVLLLAVPLGLLLRQVAQDLLLRELLDLAWGLKLRFEGLPQTSLWLGFLALACLVTLGSLVRRRRPARPRPDPRTEHPGPVQLLSERIQDAQHIEYARRRLAQELRALTLDLLAHLHRATPPQIRQRLDQGTLDLPPEIHAYLGAELSRGAARGGSLIARLRRRPLATSRPVAIDPALEAAVQFLESRLRHEPAQDPAIAALRPSPSVEEEYDHQGT